MNGIGVIIIIMQINPLLGCPVMSNTITSISAFFKNLHTINYDALLIGVITLVIVFAIPKKFNKIIPGQAIALVICTLLSMKLGLNVDKISNISITFPHLTLPKADLHAVITYFHYAVTLAIVLSSESLLTVLVADSLLKTKTPSKGMLLGQGVGNMVCALTGSLPGSAATMRTVAAINTGSSTKLTAVINPLILMFLLFKLSGFVAEIPLAVLAGILIKIGYDIIDVKLLKVIKFAPRDDLYVLAVVFLLTVFYNLIVAVGAGITCAALLYAKRTADSAKLVQKLLEKDYNHKIRVVHIDGQFFFGSATQLISQFDEMLGTKYLILDYPSENLLDISAIFALEDIIIRLQSQKVKILVVLKSDSVKEQFEKHGIINQLGNEHIFRTEPEAIDFAKKCIKKKVKKRHFWQH